MADYFLLAKLLVLTTCVTLSNSECLTCASTCGDTQVDLTFVIDGSGSICQDQEPNCQNWRNVLSFVNNIVDHMNIGLNNDRVALVQFSNQGKVEFGLTEYTSKYALQDAIRNIQHASQNTNTSGGIKVMRTEVFGQAGDRLNVPNAAVIVTDGKSTRDTDRTIPEAELAHLAGIRTFSIGVTESVDRKEVAGISSDPKTLNTTYWLLTGFDVLQTSISVAERIFRAFCATNNNTPLPLPVFNSDGCPYANSHRTGLTCYQYQSNALQWLAAEGQCQSLGGHLAAIRRSREQAYVSDLMRQYSATITWVGGKETTGKHWTYSSNGRILQGQGCYDDNEFNPDLAYKTPAIDLLTPQKCIEECRKAGYSYAGVQGGLHCYCGNDFGKYGLVQGCTITCPGDSRYKCGGYNSNYIYMIDAAWGEWSENQPNNFGDNQNCGALYYTHQYKYADESCDRPYQYLCDIPSSADCSGSSTSGQYAISSPENLVDAAKCYYIGVSKLAWHDARADCVRRGGDLASILSASEYVSVSRMLDSKLALQDGLYMWVGVQRKSFTWTNGEIIRFTNWQQGAPSQSTDECFIIDADQENRWRDVDCTKSYTYFCQWDLIPTTTTAPTTTTTTTKAKTTPSTTSTSSQNISSTVKVKTPATTIASTTQQPELPIDQPSLGASTGLVANNQNITILIALIIILIIIMIATICVLVYFNYTRRNLLVGVAVGPAETKTVKYNIYEPPRYEEVAEGSAAYANIHTGNLDKPVLDGYRHSKSYSETVKSDFNVDEHVKNIQYEANGRAQVVAVPNGKSKGKARADESDSDSETERKHRKKHKSEKTKRSKSKRRERSEAKRTLELSNSDTTTR